MIKDRQTGNFTSGKPEKQLLVFAAPLILSTILQNLYHIANAVIVGRFLGENALAVVGASGVLTSVVRMLITRITQGMLALVSQFYGADEHSLKKAVATSFCLMIIGIGF